MPRNAFTALLLLCLSAPALAQIIPPTYQRVEFVTEVAREIPNDQLNAVLSVELSDKDASRLAQQIATVVNDAMRKASAYPTVKTTSGNQNTWPVYGESMTSSSKWQSWRGRAEIRLEAKDFKAASELISKLQEKMQLNNLSFSVAPDTRRKLEENLTAEAINAFRARAESIRTAWNARGYQLVYMNLGAGGSPMPYQSTMRMEMKSTAADAVPAQDMAGGETRLVVTASGSIELQP